MCVLSTWEGGCCEYWSSSGKELQGNLARKYCFDYSRWTVVMTLIFMYLSHNEEMNNSISFPVVILPGAISTDVSFEK